MICGLRHLRKAWATLKKTFQSVSKISIDTKLSQLQPFLLKKGEHIVKYSSRILGLVSKLEIAGHIVSEV